MNIVRNLAVSFFRRRPSSLPTTTTSNNMPGLRDPFQAMNNQSLFFQYQQQTQLQIRFISKYISKSAKKRLPLSTKRAGKGYYKGKGSTKEGKLNSKGKFISDPRKKVELVVPNLEGFKVSYYYYFSS